MNDFIYKIIHVQSAVPILTLVAISILRKHILGSQAPDLSVGVAGKPWCAHNRYADSAAHPLRIHAAWLGESSNCVFS